MPGIQGQNYFRVSVVDLGMVCSDCPDQGRMIDDYWGDYRKTEKFIGNQRFSIAYNTLTF